MFKPTRLGGQAYRRGSPHPNSQRVGGGGAGGARPALSPFAPVFPRSVRASLRPCSPIRTERAADSAKLGLKARRDFSKEEAQVVRDRPRGRGAEGAGYALLVLESEKALCSFFCFFTHTPPVPRIVPHLLTFN